jgi:YidC/Oxa1 family membrane protein insertase
MFGFLGKYLVLYVGWLFKLVGSWGWAICLLTITVKLAVFPLMLPSLKTQIATRRLKPQIDEITKKYEGDMMQKNLAMQELYRKEGIRPMLGCFPLLLQMPVWIALYQALGTAVELYHTPFLMPLIPDLTHSDPYHVIPIVLGASSFLQQKMMPAQGMDPRSAEDDAVHDAGHLHDHDVLPARRPRRVHADEHLARHRPTVSRGAVDRVEGEAARGHHGPRNQEERQQRAWSD